MNISSGVNLLYTAQQRSDNAAREIVGQFLKKTDMSSTNYKSEDLIKPVLDLKRAELETSAATKIIEADKNTIGSLLDIEI
ncbi:MAG: hypothetical protein HOP23_13260 [Methylococcaceae bacterium]|nr:hypothetical protein [Methylococcaceae bacterium]